MHEVSLATNYFILHFIRSVNVFGCIWATNKQNNEMPKVLNLKKQLALRDDKRFKPIRLHAFDGIPNRTKAI